MCAVNADCCNGTCTAGICGVGGNVGNCCMVHATPGCTNAMIQMCVCAADIFCCNNNWDSACVNGVEGKGCGMCP
jgi:hypothetical protein